MDRLAPGPRAGSTVLALCLAVVVLDGFDLVIYGTVLPELLRYEPWAMSPATGGAIASYALLGLLLGALLSGPVTDRFGRRRPIIALTLLFSGLTLLCAFSTGVAMFGVLRFLVGLALGGALPLTVALSLEFAPPGRRNFYSAVNQMGYGIGAILVTLSGILVLPWLGFRALFVIAGVLGLLLVPVLARMLPESAEFLAATGRTEQAARTRERYGLAAPTGGVVRAEDAGSRRTALRLMGSAGYRRATVALPVAGFFGFLLAYGMSTWLPQLLRQSGYGLGSALALLMAANIGNIIGNVVLSRVADRVGARPTIAVAFGGAAVCVAALGLGLPGTVTYLLILAAGFGALTAQALMFGLAGTFYPAAVRGTALGWCMGLSRVGGIAGPLLGGLLVGAGLGPAWSYGAFAAAALLACLVTLLVPRTPPGAAEREQLAPGAGVPAPHTT
ncbi:MAG: MFS transporter [Actinomycetota bacterium]|nr:MFS transporter [Actinomycetota bacterium]